SIKGHKTEILTLAFSPDDARILTTEYDRIYLWDAANGKELSSITRQGGDPSIISSINWAIFSPDGNRIVIPVANSACILDAKSGNVLCTLRGHQASVSVVEFSPNGRNLATASTVVSVMMLPEGKKVSQDTTIRVSDSSTGREQFHLNPYKKSIGSI